LRVPGDDDEGPFPVRSLAIFDEDPFENAGAQVEIELDAAPYLDLYALNRGVGENDQKVNSQELSIEKLYDLEFNRFRACGHTSAMGSTEDFEDYLLPVDCRKAWCEKCGGKGGKVHKARKKAVRDRIDIEEKNLRYSVFTVPEKYREKFKSAKGLNQLIKGVERVVKKYYGEKKGFSVTVHLYGDKDKGKFNPHFNVLIPEEKSVKLKIAAEDLTALKVSWLRSLRGMGCLGIDVIDVFYEFRTKLEHKGHCIKYVTKPTWDAETLGLVDEAERWFLVLGLKGFQYIRFCGEISNRNYHEGTAQTIRESKETAEDLIGKKLYFRGVFPVNIALMLEKGHIEKLSDSLYRIKKRKIVGALACTYEQGAKDPLRIGIPGCG
jgi:hypothetical protein